VTGTNPLGLARHGASVAAHTSATSPTAHRPNPCAGDRTPTAAICRRARGRPANRSSSSIGEPGNARTRRSQRSPSTPRTMFRGGRALTRTRSPSWCTSRLSRRDAWHPHPVRSMTHS